MRAFPRDRLPVAVAIWGAMGAAAGAVGPTIGVLLVEAASWRWVFLINVPAGLVTVGLGRRVLRESSDPNSPRAGARRRRRHRRRGRARVARGRPEQRVGLDLGPHARRRSPRRRCCSPSSSPTSAGPRPRRSTCRCSASATTPVGEPRHVRVRHRLHGDVLRLVPHADPALGLVGAAGGPGDQPRTAAGRPCSPPASVAWRAGSASGRCWWPAASPSPSAGSGAWSRTGVEPNYLVDYLPAMLLSGLGVALCFPQLASVTAQALAAQPPRRRRGGEPGGPPVRRHARRGRHDRVRARPAAVRPRPRRLRPGLGDHRRRRVAHRRGVPPAPHPPGRCRGAWSSASRSAARPRPPPVETRA